MADRRLLCFYVVTVIDKNLVLERDTKESDSLYITMVAKHRLGKALVIIVYFFILKRFSQSDCYDRQIFAS